MTIWNGDWIVLALLAVGLGFVVVFVITALADVCGAIMDACDDD